MSIDQSVIQSVNHVYYLCQNVQKAASTKTTFSAVSTLCIEFINQYYLITKRTIYRPGLPTLKYLYKSRSLITGVSFVIFLIFTHMSQFTVYVTFWNESNHALLNLLYFVVYLEKIETFLRAYTGSYFIILLMCESILSCITIQIE